MRRFGFGPVFASLCAGGADGAAFTTALVTILGIAWVANGFFQSMGNPPCLKLLSHWVPPDELATKLSIWNSSHSIGAGLVTVLCGYIMGLGALGADGVGVGMWRWCFWAPAIIAGAGLALLFFTLPGTPEEEKLDISTGLTGLTRLKESSNPENPVKDAVQAVTAAKRV